MVNVFILQFIILFFFIFIFILNETFHQQQDLKIHILMQVNLVLIYNQYKVIILLNQHLINLNSLRIE